MIFVLDTNIFQKHFSLRSSHFSIFKDYLARTNSQVWFPKVIFEEIRSNYQRELRKRTKDLSRAKGHLDSALINPLEPFREINFQDETENYLAYIQAFLSTPESHIIEYRPEYLEDVIMRSIERRKPCSERGEEIRDALIWVMIKDIAKDRGDKTVTFISDNTKEFGSSEGALHPDLEAEAQSEGISVRYFTSLEEFARQHATQIEFINEAWITSSINYDHLLSRLKDGLETRVYSKVTNQIPSEIMPTGHIYLSGDLEDLDIEDFFVYEMQDGSYRVDVELKGEVEFEVELAKFSQEEEYDPSTGVYSTSASLPLTLPFTLGVTPDIRIELIYPEIELQISLDVQEQDIVDYEIFDISIYLSRVW